MRSANIDQQVKLRGYRIEPGEIEARPSEHPAIAAAAVILQAEVGDRRLLADVVARSPPVVPSVRPQRPAPRRPRDGQW